MVRKGYQKVLQYIVMALVVFIVIIPLIWLVVLSFMDNKTIMNNPLDLSNMVGISNYISAIGTLNIALLFKNTIFVALVTLAIEIPITFASAFALTRLEYKHERLRGAIYGFMLLGLAISPFILLFPTYKINHALGLGTTMSLMMPYIAASVSFNTLLFVNYMRTIPREIDEACLIDGGSLFQLMIHVTAPICKSVLATVLIFNLLYIWNEYPFASIMITDQSHYTLSRGIAFFKGRYNIDYAGIAAYSVMIILPELILYAFFQKNVMAGMTAGAVKG